MTTRSTRRKRPFPVALLDDTSASGYQRLLPKCSHVAAGGVHSVAATKAGELFTWGAGDEGQLARPVSVEDVEGPAKPARVDVPQGAGEVVRVAASDAATFALDAHGLVRLRRVQGRVRAGTHPRPAGGARQGDGSVFFGPTGGKENARRRSSKPATRTSRCSWRKILRVAVTLCTPRARALKASSADWARGALGCAAAFRASSRRLRCGCHAARASPSRCSRGLAHVRAHRDWRGCRVRAEQLGPARVASLRRRFRRRGVRLCAAGHRRVIVQKRRLHRVRRAPLAGAHRAGRDAVGAARDGRLGRAMDAGAEARDRDAACPVPAPAVFPGKVRIARVAAGMSHSACVDDKGTLFVFGSGDGYMLGRGDDDADADGARRRRHH